MWWGPKERLAGYLPIPKNRACEIGDRGRWVKIVCQLRHSVPFKGGEGTLLSREEVDKPNLTK